MSQKRKALGRGLSSLIQMDDVPATGTSMINEIELDLITPNPDQPRTTFSEEALEELSQSIKEHGIIQPLSLRKVDSGYQIIAGERRYRAALKAGLKTVPAYIRSANDTEVTEMALIENIQREDLNAIEIALTFKKLIEQYSLTQEKLSDRIGKKRATIANFLRLLRLPAEVQLGLRDKKVDMGHAKALLSINDPTLQLEIYSKIIKNGLSVRKVEELVKNLSEDSEKPKRCKKENIGDEFKILRDHLIAKFRTPISFSCDKSGKGKITFNFKNEDELERLIAIFDKINDPGDSR